MLAISLLSTSPATTTASPSSVLIVPFISRLVMSRKPVGFGGAQRSHGQLVIQADQFAVHLRSGLQHQPQIFIGELRRGNRGRARRRRANSQR